MIIIVTNRKDHTADFLILELQKRGCDYVRFNTEDFPQKIQIVWSLENNTLSGYFSFPKNKVDFQDIRSIWYRRPVQPIPSALITENAAYEFAVVESQTSIDGIWRCLDCFWVSNPDNLRKAENKLYQLKVAAQIGFILPSTLVTNDPEQAQNFYSRQNDGAIYKPLKHSKTVRDEKVNLVYTNIVDTTDAKQFDLVKYASSLFQNYVPKDVEIRVTVIGNKVFAVEIHSQKYEETRHDWRRGDMTILPHRPHDLPSKIRKKCVALIKELGLAFGAIDLILTPEGEYVFLEINPNGQWAWIQQICPEIPLRETLADLLIAGIESDP